MESPRKKMVVVEDDGGDGGDGGESSESVVVQCTETGEVEQGEEVAMESAPRRELPCSVRHGSLAAALQVCCDRANVLKKEEVVSESQEVGSGRCVDRSLVGDRKVILAGVHDEGGCWRPGARRRCRARKSFMHGPFGVGCASFVVDRHAVKRKHEEVKQCERHVVLEGDDSDDSASPSDSDASDSESEQWERRDISSKRRRGESVQQQRSGAPKQPRLLAQASVGMHKDEEEEEDYGDELKEMQQLLETQLKAAEKREAGMKQRMERMMDTLSRHMGHVEDRVCNLEEEGVHPQEQVLERIDVKLEKVMEGFSALNENLAILSAWLSKNLESQ